MQYLTVQEFAEKVNMCSRSILNSINKGKIFAIRFGPGVRSPFRIPESELERLQIASMYRKSNAEET